MEREFANNNLKLLAGLMYIMFSTHNNRRCDDVADFLQDDDKNQGCIIIPLIRTYIQLWEK